ncbi:uncharacterized protein LOC120739138 [Simochromis diagramma]|uniref:uncharacterized protein LOC120739138 n=1 Tax=Simochromis diagramma TaxID=43689 RepID=UPI001A7E5549|nr:uncharacterized protein LOC120739138 [Simochromis diagramma]
MSIEWAEDDGLPSGVVRVDREGPEDGKTYVMYHGTKRANVSSIQKSGFTQSSGGMLGRGVYLSRDLEKASRYPINHPEHDRVVIKVKVNVGKVKAINRQDHPLQKTWHDHGYDTAWVPPGCGMVPSGLEENCVWDPKRITIIETIKPKPQSVVRMDREGPRDGRTYAMYHGTTSKSARLILKSGFQRSKDGMLGPGVYLSRDLEKASRYPIGHPEYDKVVIRVRVNVGKVKAIDCQNHPLQNTWHDHGYDTAWVPPNCGMVKSGLEENCVWDPNRISIIDTIKPKPVHGAGGSACGYRYEVMIPEINVNIKQNIVIRLSQLHGQDNHTNIRIRKMYFQWAEDDFLPPGVIRVDCEGPRDGKTYAMYHGTTSANAKRILMTGFGQSKNGMLGPGVYLSRDLEKASRYPIDYPEYDRVVIKVKVNVGRVIVINYQNHPLQKTWQYSGYDTAWVPPGCGMVKSGLEENCVWDPNRISIIGTIKPKPVHGAGGSAWGYR